MNDDGHDIAEYLLTGIFVWLFLGLVGSIAYTLFTNPMHFVELGRAIFYAVAPIAGVFLLFVLTGYVVDLYIGYVGAGEG